MATLVEVERIALGLPDTEEGTSYGKRAWKVGAGHSSGSDRFVNVTRMNLVTGHQTES